MGVPWCTKCLVWGHGDRGCKNSTRCGWCGGPHHQSVHRAACYKCAGTKTIPPTPDDQECPHEPWCPNCKEKHPANGDPIYVYEKKDGVNKRTRVVCPFWLNRFNKDWYLRKYEKVRNDRYSSSSSAANKPLVASPRVRL